ncbi:hypothetical protein [Microbacterium imperiale]|uniref:hypothetical protein n=1 Tax=Microbacterium imperiale TaxID=33884 RepID=UPI001AE4FA2C|nr:hypothetical protein [Microbacterium imperiale]MBP2419888.1 hypothetical protein [Microbacterium imperiale]MDS0198248.1 hypothetical protein [Microbacterium imperiale]
MNVAAEMHLGAQQSRQQSFASPSDRTDPIKRTPAPRDCGPLNRCDDFTVSLLPQATIADVASFAPAPAELVSEPAGLGVVGLPTNFIVTATEHTATGTLFDLPVTVRFSSEGVTIAPGDGSRISSGGGGRSWGELGASQFAPTDTSHTYTERGTYSASAVVHYRAEVDFGRGWRPVPGTLDVATGPHMVRVLEARGTLVERTCDEAPRGPGC